MERINKIVLMLVILGGLMGAINISLLKTNGSVEFKVVPLMNRRLPG